MEILLTANLKQVSATYQSLNRGMYYTQTKNGAHCFRADLRFGSIYIFSSADEVTVRAKDFRGRNLKFGRISWDSSRFKARIVGYNLEEGKRNFTSKIKSLELMEFENLLLTKREPNPFSDQLKKLLASSLVFMNLSHLPWRWEEKEFCKDAKKASWFLNKRNVEMVTEDLTTSLLFPYQNYKMSIESGSNGYGIFREPTKKIAKQLFGNKGKQACKLVPQIMKKAYDANVEKAFKAFRKAGWDSNSLVELAPAIVAGGENAKELAPYTPKAVKKFTSHMIIEEANLEWDFQDVLENLKIVNSFGFGLFPIKKAKSLDHLHDALSIAVNRLKDSDFKLWKHPQLSEFDGYELDSGYTLQFPYKESDLKKWGSRLGICIGGYGDRVHSGRSVCFALYEGENLKGCAEIDMKGEEPELSQLFGIKNHSFPKEVAEEIAEAFGIAGWLKTQEDTMSKVLPSWKGEYQRLIKPDRAKEREKSQMTEDKWSAICLQALYEAEE